MDMYEAFSVIDKKILEAAIQRLTHAGITAGRASEPKVQWSGSGASSSGEHANMATKFAANEQIHFDKTQSAFKEIMKQQNHMEQTMFAMTQSMGTWGQGW